MISRDPIWNAADRAEMALSAIKTLSHLLTVAVQSGEDISDFEAGIPLLFDPQFEILEAANQELRTRLVNEKEETGNNGPDSANVQALRRELILRAYIGEQEAPDIASALNMKQAAVESVIRELRGEGAIKRPQRTAG